VARYCWWSCCFVLFALSEYLQFCRRFGCTHWLTNSMGQYFSLELLVARLVKKLLPFMDPEGSLKRVYHESNKAIPNPQNSFLPSSTSILSYLCIFVLKWSFTFSPTPHLFHPSWFAHLAIFLEMYKSWHFSFYSYIKPLVTSCLLNPNILICTLFSNTSQSSLFS
jgi:hypothetical protein